MTNKYFICRKGVEVNIWDLDNCTKIWNAKSVSHEPPSFQFFY